MKRLVICAALALAACGDKVVVSTPPVRCNTFIPESWSQGVASAPIPDTEGMSLLDQVKAWAGAYVAADGQLDKANGRTRDAIEIDRQCEAAYNEARERD